jgi:hypothetical protein
MGGFGGAIGNANFQEPSSPDQTSSPPIQDQQPQQNPQPMQGQAQGLAQALARRKKKGLIGPTVRTPSPLTAAISAAKRGRQSGHRYG